MNHSPRRGSLAHETLRLVFPPVADLDGPAGGWIGNRPRRAGPLTVRSSPAVNRLAHPAHLRSSPGVNIVPGTWNKAASPVILCGSPLGQLPVFPDGVDLSLTRYAGTTADGTRYLAQCFSGLARGHAMRRCLSALSGMGLKPPQLAASFGFRPQDRSSVVSKRL